MARTDAPAAAASADADPPPGVGSGDLKAARRSVTERDVRLGNLEIWEFGKLEI
jgi:hypothetical protein